MADNAAPQDDIEKMLDELLDMVEDVGFNSEQWEQSGAIHAKRQAILDAFSALTRENERMREYTASYDAWYGRAIELEQTVAELRKNTLATKCSRATGRKGGCPNLATHEVQQSCHPVGRNRFTYWLPICAEHAAKTDNPTLRSLAAGNTAND